MTRAWFVLILAGGFEAAFAFCLSKAKQEPSAAGWWYAGFGVCLALSMYLLILSSKSLPMGTAYAVWTGIGAFTTALIGIFYFHEPANTMRLVFLFCLIASVAGLKWAS